MKRTGGEALFYLTMWLTLGRGLGGGSGRNAGSRWRRWLLCLVLIFSPKAYPSENESDQEIRLSLEKITKAYHLAVTHLPDPVDPDQAIEGAIRGGLSHLDPFSVYLNAGQFESFQQQQRGVRQGFGAVLNVQAGNVTVLQAVPDSPFGRAGLGPGDRMVRINGHRVAALDLAELVDVLQQARSGRVQLSVIRSGKVVAEDFALDPAEVPSPTVNKKFLLQPQLGYLHVARIEQSTPEEIQAALAEWSRENLRGVILDLRNNPGGALDAAVTTAGLFLETGQLEASLLG